MMQIVNVHDICVRPGSEVAELVYTLLRHYYIPKKRNYFHSFQVKWMICSCFVLFHVTKQGYL